MKKRVMVNLLLAFILLVGCSKTPPSPTPTPTSLPTPTLAEPSARTESAPDPTEAARAYLDAWTREDYPGMYALLTSVSKDAITVDEFSQRYKQVANEAALTSSTEPGGLVSYEVHSAFTNPYNAQISYRVTLHSRLVGDISAETVMNLSIEDGEWRIQWDETLILPQLAGGNYLLMDYKVPARANIYDRAGHALVAQSDAVAIGVDTNASDPEQDNALLMELWRLTGIDPEELRPYLESYRSSGWYLPVGGVSAEIAQQHSAALAGFAGVIQEPFRSRYYFDGGETSIAPHITGFMSLIQPGEVEYYQRLGYNENERVGRAGLELWGEPYLAGMRGGSLHVVAPDGSIVTTLAATDAQPSQAIYTTIDRDFQAKVQQALAGFNGAIVVLERDTGRVLALASSPGFDPNLFEPTNFNSGYLVGDVFSEDRPTLNRAIQGLYPLGSVFKIVTMSAALEEGQYTADSTYECGYFFEELVGFRPNDWTYDHYLEDGKTLPSGTLTLPQGLMKSCNLWFWHIGLDFFRQGMYDAVSSMARGFGLGSLTGIELTEELAGNIPDPASEIDATNLAIGQGDTQVTPLQVASFVAAVGNGGTLYTPHLIERIVPPIGDPTYVFTPTIRGTLPISGTNLAIVQDAMVSVFGARGTAVQTGAELRSYNIPVAGKTGTAQSGTNEPHAWFAGYTFANRENQPDIAVAVVLEYAGEGSEWAAPIFAGVVRLYFYGQRSPFRWEVQPGLWKTPTPEVTDTPEGEENPEVTPTPEG